jgi:hypothetical protein
MSLSKITLPGLLLGFALSALFAFKILYDKPACAISVNKLNVFYVGVDNPATIVVRGVPKEQVTVRGEGVFIQKNEGDNDDYTVRATAPGSASIVVSGGDMKPQEFQYRVKKIPDPVPRLGGKLRGGTLGNGEFKAQNGIAAVLENFDFDAYCEVVSFEMTYLAKNQDPVTVVNSGSRFNGQAVDLTARAKPGDVYFFDEIKVRCPGDAAARNLGGLVFRIR